LTAANASAQASRQVWANFTFDLVRRSGVTYEIDFEPKALVAAPPEEPDWRNLDITPSVEYPVTDMFDVVGEMTLGRTRQTDDLDTTEVTARGGVRFPCFRASAVSSSTKRSPSGGWSSGTWCESNHDISLTRTTIRRTRRSGSETASSSCGRSTVRTWATTASEPFTVSEHIVDFHVKRVW
jgi:hypothetical protein